MGRGILITRITQAIVAWACEEEWGRPALENIVFEPDGCQVATNGQGLAIFEPENRGPEQPWVTQARYLPARLLRRVLAMLPEWTIEGLGGAVEVRGGVKVALRIESVDDNTMIEVIPWQPDAQGHPYPDYQRTIPTDDPLGTVDLSPRYLQRICESAEHLMADRITLSVYGPDKAVKAVCESEHGRLTIVLMPMRRTNKDRVQAVIQDLQHAGQMPQN